MSKQNKQSNTSSTQGADLLLHYEPAPPDTWGADLLNWEPTLLDWDIPLLPELDIILLPDWDINLLLLDWEPLIPEDWDIPSLDFDTTNLLQGWELLSDPKHGKG